MRQLLTSIALIATFAATGQEYVIDTLLTENIGCNGESFKLLYSDNSADMDALIQNYLNERGFLGATIIEVASVDMMSTNCWCLGGNPDSPECDDIGVCCDCCGGQAIRSFVDFIVLGYPNTPCSELPFDQQQIQCSGCTDDEALNYNHIASIEDNSCIYTHTLCQDGTVWNEELGGCIVENPTDTDLDGCTGVDDVLDVLATFGMCYTEEPVEAWECGDTLEYWGYSYETVQIDGQCLFALVGQVEELAYQNDILTDSLLVAHDSIQDLLGTIDSLQLEVTSTIENNLMASATGDATTVDIPINAKHVVSQGGSGPENHRLLSTGAQIGDEKYITWLLPNAQGDQNGEVRYQSQDSTGTWQTISTCWRADNGSIFCNPFSLEQSGNAYDAEPRHLKFIFGSNGWYPVNTDILLLD